MRALLGVLLLLIGCVVHAATFVTYDSGSAGTVVFISGSITASDGDRLEGIVKYHKKTNKKILGVSVDSGGGSLIGGIALGKVLNKYRLKTLVGAEGVAHSAAGLAVLMSNRVVIQYNQKTGSSGVIGLHRPYIVNKDKSITQISDKEAAELVEFCIRYGVKPSIAQMMIITPSTQMSEINAYNAFIFDHTIKVSK